MAEPVREAELEAKVGQGGVAGASTELVPSGVRDRVVESTTQERALARIEGESNLVLRNLFITQSYHELSRGLAEVIDRKNVNWSTFATWASKTAGRSIRNEEVPSFFMEVLHLGDRLNAYLPKWLGALLSRIGILAVVLTAAKDAVQQVSSEVSAGNLKVYKELGPLFERFIALCRDGAQDSAVEDFFAALRPGEPETDGQDLLRRAFRHYLSVRTAASDKERAELMLLANCLIGLHEQTRLQPNIQGAMDAPVDEIFLANLRKGVPFWLRGLGFHLVTFVLRRFTREVKHAWEELATRYAMNLALPEGKEISLGSDVPQLPSGFPPELRDIELPELRELVRRFDPNLSSTAGSAANNWARLEDRMGFIVELFRSRQQDEKLFLPPFSPAQEEALARGIVPSGAL